MVTSFLKRYGLALRRYRWAGLAGFLGVLGATAAFVASQPTPEENYRSEGVLVQNAPVVSFTTTGVELQQQGQGIITEEFLLSDVLLEQVAQQLNANGIAITPRTIRQNTRVDIETSRDENGQGGVLQSVSVSYTADSDEEAEAVLSVLFQGMVELSRFTNRARLGAIVSALNERLPTVEAELREAEQALEAYDRLEGPAIQAALDGSLLASISDSQNQRRQNLITLAGLDAQMQSLQAQLGLSPEAAYASQALSADPILAQLRAQIYEAETQLELLSQNLRPAHPRIIELNNNLAAYNQLLRERAAEVIGGGSNLAALPSADVVRQNSNLDPARSELALQLVGLKNQRDALIQQQQILRQSEVQLREAYSQLPNKQLERDRLAQQVALKRALYDQIQAKRIDAQAAEAETVSSLTVASPPSTTEVPADATSPLVMMLVGTLIGLGLGGGIVYLLDMLDSTIRIREDLEKIFEDQDIPVIGTVPATANSRKQPVLMTDANHPWTEVYERLRSNLHIAAAQVAEGKIPKVVLITSVSDLEGKTTTAYNLGIASARSGRRTLIVEVDFRHPSQAWRLGVRPNEQAIIEPLRYYGSHLVDPIQMVPSVENLYIAPGVGPQRNPAAVLDSSELARFLQDAKARFDFIAIDAPNLTGSNDAVLMQRTTDGMVIVTRPNYTQKPSLTTALEQIEENEEIRILGAVINAAHVSSTVTTHRLDDSLPLVGEADTPQKARSQSSERIPVGTPFDI